MYIIIRKTNYASLENQYNDPKCTTINYHIHDGKHVAIVCNEPAIAL